MLPTVQSMCRIVVLIFLSCEFKYEMCTKGQTYITHKNLTMTFVHLIYNYTTELYNISILHT